MPKSSFEWRFTADRGNVKIELRFSDGENTARCEVTMVPIQAANLAQQLTDVAVTAEHQMPRVQ